MTLKDDVDKLVASTSIEPSGTIKGDVVAVCALLDFAFTNIKESVETATTVLAWSSDVARRGAARDARRGVERTRRRWDVAGRGAQMRDAVQFGTW
mmetsp:Transcript_28027/g.86706  ORF Transcript_28027/g.86706 Transcript_28027/m.86706 type:complete len:96 (-) Transcript_28027:351-638(-)